MLFRILLLIVVGVGWRDASGANSLSTGSWPANGVGICAGPGEQGRTGIVYDGAGGVIVTWRDARAITHNVYALRITASGGIAPGWPSCGVRVCTAPGNEDLGGAVTDGHGGAIVYWDDDRSGPTRVFAQRVSADGLILWDPNGVAACAADSQQIAWQSAIPDGRGGMIIAWHDRRRAPPSLPPHYDARYDLFSQHMDASGARLWDSLGVPVCADSGDRALASVKSVATDGADGAIALFADNVRGAYYAQHLDGSGTRQWGPDGAPIPDVRGAEVISDGSAGAFMAWSDSRNGNADVWLHHVDSRGQVLSPVGGIAVCTAAFDQRLESRGSSVASDGAGGVFLTWYDERNGQDWDIFAQRILASGAVAPGWPVNGIPICVAPGFQIYPAVVSDASGGTIMTWYDARNTATGYDVYAQRITGAGAIAPGWPANGVALCSAPGDQVDPIPTTDGGAGMIAYWDDYRGSDVDIYAQHVSGGGIVGVVTTAVGVVDIPHMALEAPHPDPTSGDLLVSFSLSTTEPARVSLFDIAGREVSRRDLRAMGPGRHSIDLAQVASIASGVYVIRLTQGDRSLSRRVSVVH